MKYLLSIVALVALASASDAGPIRRWIKDRRPGVLIPKRIAPSPIAGPAGGCVCSSTGLYPGTCGDAACPAVSPAPSAAPQKTTVPGPAVRYEYRQTCDGKTCKLVLVPVSP